MIKNKTNLADQIMGQSRHQFIYGYNGEERQKFLNEAVAAYPIFMDASRPVGIYVCDKGLPELPQKGNELDEIKAQILNRDYVECLIVSKILDTAIEQIDEKVLFNRSKELLDKVNKLFVPKGKKELTSLIDFRNVLEEVKKLYFDGYVKYINSGHLDNNFYNKVSVRIIMIEHFVEYFKKMINSTSYLSIVFDQQEPFSKESQKVINNYIGFRINANMSIKVACEPQEWRTYYSQNGVLIEDPHDYSSVELDDCYMAYVENIKKKSKISFY